ncbi:MAG: hypothetical protein OEZ38_01270 [Gammaproteobacteria bacterium]|nr:hypothetical protein [Gammaproteobacteria bacterium]
MKKSGLLVVISCVFLFLSACGVNTQYVVHRDVPVHPSFTVIPTTYQVEDFQFKARIESFLIRLGLAVIETPLSKRPEVITKPESLSKLNSSFSDKNKSLLTAKDLVDTSIIYDSSVADYILLANSEAGVLKLTQRPSGEILAVIEYTMLDKPGSRLIKLYEALNSLGFKLKKISTEEKSKMAYPLKEKSLMRN